MDVDHRSLAIGAGEQKAYLSATFSDVARNTIYLEVVHRLTDAGVVASHAASGTSGDGFDAEWRMIGLFVVEGDLLGRVEVFDDGEVDAALARFDQLSGTT